MRALDMFITGVLIFLVVALIVALLTEPGRRRRVRELGWQVETLEKQAWEKQQEVADETA